MKGKRQELKTALSSKATDEPTESLEETAAKKPEEKRPRASNK